MCFRQFWRKYTVHYYVWMRENCEYSGKPNYMHLRTPPCTITFGESTNCGASVQSFEFRRTSCAETAVSSEWARFYRLPAIPRRLGASELLLNTWEANIVHRRFPNNFCIPSHLVRSLPPNGINRFFLKYNDTIPIFCHNVAAFSKVLLEDNFPSIIRSPICLHRLSQVLSSHSCSLKVFAVWTDTSLLPREDVRRDYPKKLCILSNRAVHKMRWPSLSCTFDLHDNNSKIVPVLYLVLKRPLFQFTQRENG